MSFARPADDLSAVPLAALSAIVLDTETTGLDTARDRVIEIAAVRLEGGSMKEEGWSRLVDPDMRIPPASRAIHGITDSNLAGAAEFPDVFRDYLEWAGASLVIGFSLGFDLAVLRAEHERHEMSWRAPRGLDVRHLLQILALDLPDLSLETAAARFGVETAGRHRALSDARMTASLFIALLPELKARGIVTLAQAERACERLSSERSREEQAGWVSTADPGEDSLPRIDSYLFRHRVRDVMKSPPVIIENTVPLRDALSLMMSEKVSSVFIDRDDETGEYGIVTERDLLRALAADGDTALNFSVRDIANRPLVAVPGSEFVYRALSEMTGRGFRHLGVYRGDGELVGALSARDMLRQRSDDAIALGGNIDRADSPAALGTVWAGLTGTVRALVAEEMDARDIAAVISRELRALTARACKISIDAMAAEGKGTPPAEFALLVLGSGGRGESLLAMDQDNAILYADGAPDGADGWFAELGKRVADLLADAGVAYCKGGIMAANAAWRHDFAGWRDLVGRWVSRGKPEDMLNSDIFFDARCALGVETLFGTLREEAAAGARGSRTFLNFLALRAGEYSSPIGMFGRFKTEAGRIDLKMLGIMPIFSAARVAALRGGIAHRSTRGRLAGLRDAENISARAVDNLIEAHGILLDLILRQQLRDIPRGVALSNRVAPQELTDYDKDQLKWALEQVPLIDGLLGIPTMGR